MSRRSRFIPLAALAFAGCQDKSQEAPAPAPTPTPTVLADVVVKDSAGTTLAELKQLQPCRATIGPAEMIVGGSPLTSTVGSTTWNGAVDTNGTTYTRNDERIARSYPVGDAAQGAIYDLTGVAQIRVDVTGDTATVTNKASVTVRKLTRAGGAITVSDPALTVTGTDDLILAALLSAPELLPEVRMLAACERVLVKKGSK